MPALNLRNSYFHLNPMQSLFVPTRAYVYIILLLIWKPNCAISLLYKNETIEIRRFKYDPMTIILHRIRGKLSHLLVFSHSPRRYLKIPLDESTLHSSFLQARTIIPFNAEKKKSSTSVLLKLLSIPANDRYLCPFDSTEEEIEVLYTETSGGPMGDNRLEVALIPFFGGFLLLLVLVVLLCPAFGYSYAQWV